MKLHGKRYTIWSSYVCATNNIIGTCNIYIYILHEVGWLWSCLMPRNMK